MIQSYQDECADAMVRVWRRASDKAHPFLPKAFQDQEEDNVMNLYPQHAEIWVKLIDQKVVGFIALLGEEVGGFFVDPDYQGNGYGRELMDFAVDSRGARTLEVFEKNMVGRRFYERYGFSQSGHGVHEQTGEAILMLALDRQQP